jgi:V/A-type H+-transporting ATPase subunit C
VNITIDFKPDLRYAYATGRIRVLESKLLSSSRIEKMIDSPTITDALIYLEDTAYDDTIGEVTDPEHYEDLVLSEKRSAFDLMEHLVIDKDIRHMFRIPYDFNNVKLLLKKRLSEKETTLILSDFGTITADEMRSAFDTENFNPLPEFIRETIGQALAHHYQKKDLKSMECIIDNLEYRTILNLARRSTVPMLSLFTVARIDLTNIASFIRIKYFDTDDSLEDVIIEGGNLDALFFMKGMSEPLETIPTILSNTPYHDIVEKGVRKILDHGSFSTLDRETENYLMELLKYSRYVTFGAEPLFAYFTAREQDLNIIKMILVGKLNELSREEMRERIPVTYN